MITVMAQIDAHLRTRLRIIIWKQWKVPKRRQWGLQKLGIGKDLARVTAYCGDRYYWVATKTCVSRAISKDILAKAGLISCLDYYNGRHALKLCWTAVCRTARTVVWEGEENSPYSITGGDVLYFLIDFKLGDTSGESYFVVRVILLWGLFFCERYFVGRVILLWEKHTASRDKC